VRKKGDYLILHKIFQLITFRRVNFDILIELIIILLLILAFANFVGSAIGFADALIMIPLMALFIDVRTAIILSGFWSAWLSILNAIKYRDQFDMKFWKKYAIPAILGAILGSTLIIVAPLEWLQFSLSLFILTYICAKIADLIKVKKIISENGFYINERSVDSIPTSLFYTGSFSYGFLAGLIGASGPINVVLLERTGHEKENFIQNFAVASLTVAAFRLSIYVWGALFPIDFLLLFLLGLIVIFLATRAGHWITPKIPKQTFQALVLLLLFIIAIRMLLSLL